jgi:hypothetical protein
LTNPIDVLAETIINPVEPMIGCANLFDLIGNIGQGRTLLWLERDHILKNLGCIPQLRVPPDARGPHILKDIQSGRAKRKNLGLFIVSLFGSNDSRFEIVVNGLRRCLSSPAKNREIGTVGFVQKQIMGTNVIIESIK